jgi:hypothetical protein
MAVLPPKAVPGPELTQAQKGRVSLLAEIKTSERRLRWARVASRERCVESVPS